MPGTASCQPSPRHLLLLILLPALVLGACADKRPAPIEDHSRPGTLRADERYVVLRGDTLFAIAFRFGLDFRRLAAANGIDAPYRIFPGQQLRLAEAEPARRRASASTPAIADVKPPPVPPSAGGKVAAAPPTPAERPPATRAPTVTPKAAQPAQTAAVAPVAGAWRWPARGTITRRFEVDLHKGLDISGDRGDPVVATAAGTVVYAGSGIAGYGLMLIIRHSDEYLSAYGHNDALLVDEGDVVRAGQQLGRRGSSGTDSVKLHFEIRRRGRPVDPLRLLPARQGG